MNITINVTQEYINNGKLGDFEFCPIAKAVNNVLKDDYFASVTYVNIVIDNRVGISNRKYITTPEIASDFIVNFDCHLDVTPFNFNLIVPDDLIYLFK